MGTNHESGQSRSRPQQAPSLGTVFEILSRKRRRHIIEALVEHRSLVMADLAELVTCAEHEIAFTDLDEQLVLETYTELWHVDIPKLEESGLIAYDQESDVVALAPAADAIDGFIF